jgi:hypothetical protein
MRLQSPARLVAGLALLLNAGSAAGQGNFQNLGFESASLVPIPGDPYGRVQFALAFPGWTGFVGPGQQAAALYNSSFLDTSGVSIIDQGWPVGELGAGGVISGNYTAILQAGLFGTQPADTTLSQTALVPSNAQSLVFKGYMVVDGISGSFNAALGGQTLSLTALGAGVNYTLFGADVHSWAGQTAELKFTVEAQQPHIGNTYLFLDSIQFSDQPVPEPGILGLSALGALLLGWRILGRWR